MSLHIILSSLEPYVCTGCFQSDFNELCKREKLNYIPPVVMRAHRPISPSSAPVIEERTKPGKKDDKKNAVIPEPEPEAELDENGGMKHLFLEIMKQ